MTLRKLFTNIIAPLVVAIASGLTLWWVTSPSDPVQARVSPQSTSVNVANRIVFSAAESRDPGGDATRLSYLWELNGEDAADSRVARCLSSQVPHFLHCRFRRIGGHIVTVTASNAAGSTSRADASVNVEPPNQILQLKLEAQRAPEDPVRENLVRAVLLGVDWWGVQEEVDYPIALDEPPFGPIYTWHFNRDVEKAKEHAQRVQMDQLRLIVPVGTGLFPRSAIRKIEEELEEVGIAAQLIRLGIDDVFPALDRGLAEGGVLSVTDPDEIDRYVR